MHRVNMFCHPYVVAEVSVPRMHFHDFVVYPFVKVGVDKSVPNLDLFKFFACHWSPPSIILISLSTPW